MKLFTYLKSKLGLCCPICGGQLLYWRGCSHTPASTYCENRDYEIIHNGESASAIAFPVDYTCKSCGGTMVVFMHAGIKEMICPVCGNKTKVVLP